MLYSRDYITYGPPGAGDREVGGCIRNCPAHVFLFSCLPLPALPSSSLIFPHLPSSSVASLLLFPSSPLRPCPLFSLLSRPSLHLPVLPHASALLPFSLLLPSSLCLPLSFILPPPSPCSLLPFPAPSSPFPAPCRTVQNFQICHSRLCWQNYFKTKKNNKQHQKDILACYYVARICNECWLILLHPTKAMAVQCNSCGLCNCLHY